MSDEVKTAGRRGRRRVGGKRTRRVRSVRRGGGYGFGGSILSDAGGTNAGSAQWDTTPGSCGTGENVVNRGGNNTLAGGRRRRGRRHRKAATRRRHRRGGGSGSGMAFVSPRIGYGFNGTGEAGLANPVPINGNSVSV